ncbi:MAG: adenylate/guanylate cyclase domain-containing protein [Omnitrophica WOR_2 bacterium]
MNDIQLRVNDQEASFPPGKITLTFLFTDIEGSTSLWEHQPERMRKAIQSHHEVLRQAIESNGGTVFRIIGDAFCASFPAAPPAVAAAVEAQSNLFSTSWDLEKPIRVRMALHTGAVVENKGDYLGASLNHIGRLLPSCHGGQTVLTLITRELVQDSLPEGVHLIDLGLHHFRDLVHTEHIFQLSIPGLPDRFPPLKSLDSYPNNLPVQLTSFVGRERELGEIQKQVNSSRLVTLTGPGGTGKTRLALQAASGILENFPDGIWFIQLANISDPGLILQTLAGVLNLREQPNQPLETLLQDTLRPKRLLLVFDNCEHLIEECVLLADTLLHNCPEIKIMTTSREMFGIDGETIYRVPSLSLPAGEPQPSLNEIEASEAVRLFVQRAKALQPQFALTSKNAPAVLQICQRLDGIPLAIELAAARVKLLTPEQIAYRLSDRFSLLTGGSRTALPRQQTLEALFDWSYDLLSDIERIFFRRLSVFSGGWTIEDAEAVCADQEESDPMTAGQDEPASGTAPSIRLHRSDILELLNQLISKSLVVADQQDGETHYRMLETVRQYAQKKLVEMGEGSEIRNRHMAYYAHIAWDMMGNIYDTGFQWFFDHRNWFLAEMENYRTVREWALEHDLKSALLFCGTLFFYWGLTGFGSEMHRYVREVLKRTELLPEYQGELAPKMQKLLASAWLARGLLSQTSGLIEEAFQSSQKSAAYAYQAGDPALLALVLSVFSEGAGLMGNASLAYDKGEESIALSRRLNKPFLLAMTLLNTAAYALNPLGDFEQAYKYVEESKLIFREINDPWGISMATMATGTYQLSKSDYDGAKRSFSESLEGMLAIGNSYFANVNRSGLADATRYQGKYAEAIPLYIDTTINWHILGNLGAIARCLECLAFIAGERGKNASPVELDQELTRAALLFGAAEAMREKNQAKMTLEEKKEYDRSTAEIQAIVDRQEMTRNTYQAAWAKGRGMNVDQVISYLKESK